jgi:hypothetical protein
LEKVLNIFAVVRQQIMGGSSELLTWGSRKMSGSEVLRQVNRVA